MIDCTKCCEGCRQCCGGLKDCCSSGCESGCEKLGSFCSDCWLCWQKDARYMARHGLGKRNCCLVAGTAKPAELPADTPGVEQLDDVVVLVPPQMPWCCDTWLRCWTCCCSDERLPEWWDFKCSQLDRWCEHSNMCIKCMGVVGGCLLALTVLGSCIWAPILCCRCQSQMRWEDMARDQWYKKTDGVAIDVVGAQPVAFAAAFMEPHHVAGGEGANQSPMVEGQIVCTTDAVVWTTGGPQLPQVPSKRGKKAAAAAEAAAAAAKQPVGRTPSESLALAGLGTAPSSGIWTLAGLKRCDVKVIKDRKFEHHPMCAGEGSGRLTFVRCDEIRYSPVNAAAGPTDLKLEMKSGKDAQLAAKIINGRLAAVRTERRASSNNGTATFVPPDAT